MLVIAHRGASAHAPENTLAAFRRALELGARAVEFDVHQIRDGELVVAHDDDLRRCGGDRRRLRDLSGAEAARVDVGSWFGPEFAGERLPSLARVLDALPPPVELHVELKHGSKVYPGIEARVLELARRRAGLGRVVFSSFDHPALHVLRGLASQARLGYLLGLKRLTGAWDEMAALGAESLHLGLRQATPRAIRAARERGYKVLVYTVDAPADRDRLARLGVDGIFSNDPALDRWR